MKQTLSHIAWVALAIALGDAAFACSPGRTQAWSKPIKVDAECSFVDAGRGDFGHGKGAPVEDLGNQKVSQIITTGSHACTSDQTLIFIDCSTKETVALAGSFVLYDPNAVRELGRDATSVTLIQSPHGPISLSSETKRDDLVAVANENGLRGTTNLKHLWRKNSEFYVEVKRFDPFCGCKLHYPDSPGAKS